MKKNILIAFSFLILTGCNNQIEDISESNELSNSKISVEELYDTNSTLKREFGKALMISLNESKILRDLIKSESLEMFDNDYEVLYEMIKNVKLENGLSLRENLLKNIGNEDRLLEIELNNPTLTILVPELPEDSFSAKLWNTDAQIPKVAIRLNTSNDVPVINQDGTESVIESKYTPGFPIIVIKDNERIVSSKNINFKTLKTSKVNIKANIVLKGGTGVEFKFLDDAFDKSKSSNNPKLSNRNVTSGNIDNEVIEAHNINDNNGGDLWERDYLYYGIMPNSPDGQFKYDFQETLTSFTMQGDPKTSFNIIADQTNDPYLISKGRNGWAGGYFEFKVRFIVNAKNGIGTEIVKYFTATPDELFGLTSEKIGITGLGPIYSFKITSFKTKNLNIPVFNWDLNQYASTIKIEIEEIDLTETTTLTDSRTVKFANNFSIDPTQGLLKKIGLKFGASLETTQVSTVQKTFTQGNDLLGDVIVNFADKIIISQSGSTYTTREYSSGLYSISVEPVKVQ